jgi:hypothetical protein
MNFHIGDEDDLQIFKINNTGQEPSLTLDGNAGHQTLYAFQSPKKQ